jgi:DNA-directed RNA polymerase subunit M/transcription elongation factor TFIIS
VSTRRQRSQPRRIGVLPEFERRMYREARMELPSDNSPPARRALLRFGEIQECPKCGEQRRFFRRSWQSESGWEWIEWECRCGYKWSEETRDTPSDLPF